MQRRVRRVFLQRDAFFREHLAAAHDLNSHEFAGKIGFVQLQFGFDLRVHKRFAIGFDIGQRNVRKLNQRFMQRAQTDSVNRHVGGKLSGAFRAGFAAITEHDDRAQRRFLFVFAQKR
jgi:hypothetical protein